MQYTLRNIPPLLDRALRQKARTEGKSINEVALEAMARGAGLADQPVKHRELRDLAGTWVEDPQFDQALRDQDQVDPESWK